jgi:hypothetical protein
VAADIAALAGLLDGQARHAEAEALCSGPECGSGDPNRES